MPDIQIFDPNGFFEQKLNEFHQQLTAKKAEIELLRANRINLERTIGRLSALSEEHQRALQLEVASLREALHSTSRAAESLEGEIETLVTKIAALQVAQSAVVVS